MHVMRNLGEREKPLFPNFGLLWPWLVLGSNSGAFTGYAFFKFFASFYRFCFVFCRFILCGLLYTICFLQNLFPLSTQLFDRSAFIALK